MNDTLLALRTFRQNDAAAFKIFELLAARRNDAQITKVDRLHSLLAGQRSKFSRQDVLRVLQKLEELGLGRFKAGRKGWPSRLEWTTSMLAVVRAATGETDELDLNTPPAPHDDTDVDSDEEPPRLDEDVLEHVFHIRADFTARLQLPIDFTADEARRLSQFILTLPMPVPSKD